MTKRIRYINCINPDEVLHNLDMYYSSWCRSPTDGLKQIILNKIIEIQPYFDFELLYEGINYNI